MSLIIPWYISNVVTGHTMFLLATPVAGEMFGEFGIACYAYIHFCDNIGKVKRDDEIIGPFTTP